MHCRLRRGSHELRFGGTRRSTREPSSERGGNWLKITLRGQEADSPTGEYGFEHSGVAFVGESIEAGINLLENCVKRAFGAVPRMKIKFSGVARVCEGENGAGACELPKAGWDERCADSLAETKEKIAPAKIDALRLLAGPGQCATPSAFSVKPKLTSWSEAVKKGRRRECGGQIVGRVVRGGLTNGCGLAFGGPGKVCTCICERRLTDARRVPYTTGPHCALHDLQAQKAA